LSEVFVDREASELRVNFNQESGVEFTEGLAANEVACIELNLITEDEEAGFLAGINNLSDHVDNLIGVLLE
jgi:O-phosphoseryl-tRNA(Cys) synthetase